VLDFSLTQNMHVNHICEYSLQLLQELFQVIARNTAGLLNCQNFMGATSSINSDICNVQVEVSHVFD
jgi:hypothetical protein